MNVLKETILITGAAGFVGACLTHHLVRLGVKPHVLLMNATDAWRLTAIKHELIIHDSDITDRESLKRIINNIQPTIIYHLAAHGAYPTQIDATRIFQTNVIGTWNLLDALKDIKYKLLVNTGSSSEYGYKNAPMQESDPLAPNSVYALAKAHQTLLCAQMASLFSKPIVTFRLFSIYGPWEEPTRLIPTILKRSQRGESLLMANPQTARDFVFVDDVIKAYLSVDQLVHHPGEVFNLASGKQQSLSQVVDALQTVIKKPIEVKWGSYPPRSWDATCWVGDSIKTHQRLSWQATTTLNEGLTKTLEWMKCHDQC